MYRYELRKLAQFKWVETSVMEFLMKTEKVKRSAVLLSCVMAKMLMRSSGM